MPFPEALKGCDVLAGTSRSVLRLRPWQQEHTGSSRVTRPGTPEAGAWPCQLWASLAAAMAAKWVESGQGAQQCWQHALVDVWLVCWLLCRGVLPRDGLGAKSCGIFDANGVHSSGCSVWVGGRSACAVRREKIYPEMSWAGLRALRWGLSCCTSHTILLMQVRP